jgi:hypothetical protein
VGGELGYVGYIFFAMVPVHSFAHIQKTSKMEVFIPKSCFSNNIFLKVEKKLCRHLYFGMICTV